MDALTPIANLERRSGDCKVVARRFKELIKLIDRVTNARRPFQIYTPGGFDPSLKPSDPRGARNLHRFCLRTLLVEWVPGRASRPPRWTGVVVPPRSHSPTDG